MGICGSKEETSQITTSTAATSPVVKKNESLQQSNGEKPPKTNNTVATTTNSKQKKSAKGEVKVLLLGSGESGKSTMLKQIKIIHQNGFSKRELYDYKPFVFKNIMEASQSLVNALKQFHLTDQLTNLNSDDIEAILSFEAPMDTDYDQLDPVFASKIRLLSEDAVTKKMIQEKRRDFYLPDSAQYFLENLDRISGEGYIPNVTDVLRTRKQTSGIYDSKFQLEDIDVHLYDVGGQRSERKKWIHCFDNVTVIMFCVALSEYDQVLLESPDQNRLEESINLFESVVNSMWFKRTAVILCLNKIDIFVEKLPNSPLENYFSDYIGGNDVQNAVKYILWRFQKVNRANLAITPYLTQATDTSNMKLVFAVVKETILHNSLMDSGIVQA